MTHICNGSGPRDWRHGYRHSHMVVLAWSTQPQYAQIQRRMLAYAQELGKPIRILLIGAARLPEDVCIGYADVEVERVTALAQIGPQIQRWLAALPPAES